jgi:hypothetical protein
MTNWGGGSSATSGEWHWNEIGYFLSCEARGGRTVYFKRRVTKQGEKRDISIPLLFTGCGTTEETKVVFSGDR